MITWPGAGQYLRNHFEESIATKRRLLDACEPQILAAAALLTDALARGGKIMLCGNGGSAADCQHIAAELVVRLTHDFVRPGLPALSLCTDSSMLTASANDFGFAEVFVRQVQALGRPGDALIAISTSGNSENIGHAVAYANQHGIPTVGLTGEGESKLAAAAQVAIRVPSKITAHVQESHIAIGHVLCAIIERSLYPPV